MSNDVVSAEVSVLDAEPVSAAVVAEKIASMREGTFVWSPTLTGGSTFDERKAVVKAMTTAEPLSGYMEKPIKLRTFVVQGVELSPDEAGEVTNAIRTILVATDGKAYAAVSDGIFKALQVMVQVLGPVDTWVGQDVTVKAVSGKARRGSFFTLELV